MSAQAIPRFVQHLRRRALRVAGDSDSDGELLERFVMNRDEAAFTHLVRRHGPMVLGVCRRVLGHEADAEDACQATFLIFVRKAASIRPRGKVAGWLHGVARNVARRARRMAARRRRLEEAAGRVPRPVGSDSDLCAAIDREVNRLPERYRSPVVLCDLEGMTRAEAARHLGWAEGTVASRLSRARQLLGRRLIRAGLGVPAAGLGVAVQANGASLFDSIIAMAAGRSPAPASVTNLAKGAIRTMTLNRFAVAATMIAAVAISGLVLREALPGASGQAPPPPLPRKVPAASGGATVANDINEVSIQSVPPVVVKTVPAAGADDVDSATAEIKVTFSKGMMDESWSWSTVTKESFPPTVGDKPIHYEKDKRTCVMQVKLEPGKTYGIWLNSNNFGNFKDADGRAAVPYLLVFKTKKKG